MHTPILFYSAGIAAIAAGNYDLLATLFFKPKIGTANNEEFVVLGLYPAKMMEAPHDRLPPMKSGETAPTLHDYLLDLLRDPFRDILPHDATYRKAFDRLEYLAVLVRADWKQRQGKGSWVGLGRFACDCDRPRPHNIMDEIENEMAGAEDDWEPLRAGLFEGSLARAREVKSFTDKEIKNYMMARDDIYER